MRAVRILVALFVLFSTVDVCTTLALYVAGYQELNPFARQLLQRSPATFAVVMSALHSVALAPLVALSLAFKRCRLWWLPLTIAAIVKAPPAISNTLLIATGVSVSRLLYPWGA